VRDVHRPRLAARRNLDGADEVESQADEVDEVVACQLLAAEMRVDEAEPAEPSFGGPKPADVRKHEAAGVANDDVVDLARTMDERADLTTGLDARFDERTDELGRSQIRERDASSIDALERLRRRRRETGGVSVEFDVRNLIHGHLQVEPYAGNCQFQTDDSTRG
jgi:hypothetical protein